MRTQPVTVAFRVTEKEFGRINEIVAARSQWESDYSRAKYLHWLVKRELDILEEWEASNEM